GGDRWPRGVGGHGLRVHLSVRRAIDGELREEITLELRGAAEPVGDRDLRRGRNAGEPVAVSERERLDDRDPVHHHQPVGARHVHALLERAADDGQDAEEEQGHRERARRQRGSSLLPEEVRQDQAAILHRARPAVSAVSTCRRRSAFDRPVSSSSSSTFWKAASTWIRWYIWKTNPTWRARHAVSSRADIRVISSPATVTLPPDGTSSPPNKFSS